MILIINETFTLWNMGRNLHRIPQRDRRFTMKKAIDGFLKFQSDTFPERVELFRCLATQQSPRTLFISCSDSRMVPDLVTQREPGDLFMICNAGNYSP